jgi:uroporphyrinogen-III decarboxylase
MNSNQRVHAALKGEIPDRVPIGEFAVDFDTVEKLLGHETYLRAKAKSQIAFWERRYDEVEQSYIADHIAMHEKLDLDILVFAMATWWIPEPTDDVPPRRIDATTWKDKYERVYKYSDATGDVTVVEDPVTAARVFTVEEFLRAPEERRMNAASMRVLRAVTDRFKGKKFIAGPNAGETGVVLLGDMTRGLMELLTNPDTVRAAAESAYRDATLNDKNFIQPDHDGIIWGQDWAFKTGPFFNPIMFREIFMPWIRRHVESIHKDYGKRVIKHACGNNWKLLDMFVEIGYDCYQSIQPTADMDIAEVKKKYGKKIALWGGVPVEEMVGGTAEQVRQSVRRAMKFAKPGGGFILGTSHSIAVGSKYDNFMAMLDEHAKLASYRQ